MQEVEILLVEDNPYDAELTIRALKKHNFANKIFHVKDGAEALDFLFAKGSYSQLTVGPCPRVVILDLKLPKVDGLEVLRKMKRDVRTRTIPVVVLTSSQEEQDIVESYNLGVNSFVTKPVEFENFMQAVAKLGFYWMLLNQPPQ